MVSAKEARHAYRRAAEITATYAAQYPAHRYNQACYIAQTIPLSPSAARDSLGVEAIAVLRQAIEAGYRDRAAMDNDSDLDPLRERADFRALMASIRVEQRL